MGDLAVALGDTSSESVPPNPDDQEGSVGLVEKRVWYFATPDEPFVLENRQFLTHVEIAYETYGTLNPSRDNAILICHGITGSSHAAGKYATTNKSVGYWDALIGPGKVFDTNRFFILAPNALGGCRGTTGPASRNPQTGKPYGLSFPIVTIRDMVRVQARQLDALGIERLAMVVGGSMGGMQALEWAVTFPDRVKACVSIAACARLSARGIAFNEIARRAIRLDPHWRNGEYYDQPNGPDAGLSLARMIGTISYLSDALMSERFGRKPAERESALEHDLHARFDVERYLHDEGEALVKRFDANSYLYVSKAVDLHDVSRGYANLDAALSRVTAKSLCIAISCDDLFPPHQTVEVVEHLHKQKKWVRYHRMESNYGHDAFLVEWRKLLAPLRAFIAECC